MPSLCRSFSVIRVVVDWSSHHAHPWGNLISGCGHYTGTLLSCDSPQGGGLLKGILVMARKYHGW